MTFTSSSVFRTPGGAAGVVDVGGRGRGGGGGAGPRRSDRGGHRRRRAGEVGALSSVEITATVSGDAELAADATVKYRDTSRRALEALNGLKIAGLTVEPGAASRSTRASTRPRPWR